MRACFASESDAIAHCEDMAAADKIVRVAWLEGAAFVLADIVVERDESGDVVRTNVERTGRADSSCLSVAAATLFDLVIKCPSNKLSQRFEPTLSGRWALQQMTVK